MIRFLEQFNKPKNWLVLANVFMVFFLIVLGNTNVIPLDAGDFIFFSILALAFALYRPGWAFLFFCGAVPLENINLAPASLGMMIRPYQFIGGILIVALIIRKLSGRLNFKMPKFNLADLVVLVLAAVGFLSAIGDPIGVPMMAPIKLSVILATFAALYFLVRVYIQDIDDLKKTVPFFLSSAIIVTLYGIWQNIAFLHGWHHFEAMPGRPNGTFVEADWLGAYLVIIVSLIYAVLYKITNFKKQNPNQIQNHKSESFDIWNLSLIWNLTFGFWISIVFLIIAYTTLILTVSRSAWLAAFAAYIIFVWIFFSDLRFKNWRWKETSILKLKIISSLVLAALIIFIFHLTNFQLGNRIQSTGSGMQKITISCAGEDAAHRVSINTIIQDTSELENTGCRQINLEDIETEKATGNFVTEVYRKDPNVSIRSQIYQKSWQEIKNHPIFGIGWGAIGTILGTDGRGEILNSSNIFLQTWLGAGIIGFLALVFLFGYILFNAIKNYRFSAVEAKPLQIFIISSWFGIVIFNLFNAGIMLGFLWVWLAISMVNPKS